MMAPKKSEAGVSKPRQKQGKGPSMMTFVIVAAGIIVVIALALLLFSGGGSKQKPAARRATIDSLGESSVAARPKRAVVPRESDTRAKKEAERAKLREERAQRRLEARATGGRTTRTSSGGYSGGGATATSSPNELRAILTDNSGSRTALVGERRLRVGDDIDGRRILEVSSDGVKVEYKANTYTVRVGQKVY